MFYVGAGPARPLRRTAPDKKGESRFRRVVRGPDDRTEPDSGEDAEASVVRSTGWMDLATETSWAPEER